MLKSEMLKKLERINDLPTLPAIAMEVNRMLQNDDVSIDSLCEVIEKDQAIVAKLLKLSNSAFFGLRFKVKTVREAAMLLGFSSVRNVVVSVSVIKSFCGIKSIEGLNIEDFWKHSISVAIIGKELAKQSELAQPDEAFLGGLLHDIGKIVMIQHFPEEFKDVWERLQVSNELFFQAEEGRQIAGHALIGGILAQKWKLPELMVHAIRYHEKPSVSCSDYNLVLIVHMANMLANALQTDGKVNKKFLANIHKDAIAKMKPQTSNINSWYPSIRAEINEACEFFMEGR